ncbi:MAG: DUF4424 family protein [Micropepsaceae bacterium]
MLSRFLKTTALAAVLAGAAHANDGFGGLTAAGLEFRDSPVQMLSEDLYISPEKIKVSYVFLHGGDEDLEGEMIFPLPPINLGALMESDFALSQEELAKENIVGFTANVDGKSVPVKVDRIAVLEDNTGEEEPPASANYDSPGTDVTALLKKYDIPLSYDVAAVSAALDKLPQAAKDELSAANIATFDDSAGYPMWSIIERYHWTQVFPHGKEVKIAHEYKAAPPGGIFIWRDPKSEDGEYAAHLASQYCIDEGTQAAIKKALRQDEGDKSYWVGSAYYIDYVLKTARTWNGPIKDFRLTLDKGKADSVISLCIDGIKKTGATTFVVEKKDFTPDKDISVLLIPKVPAE